MTQKKQKVKTWIFSGQINSWILNEKNSLRSNSFSFYKFFEYLTLASKSYVTTKETKVVLSSLCLFLCWGALRNLSVLYRCCVWNLCCLISNFVLLLANRPSGFYHRLTNHYWKSNWKIYWLNQLAGQIPVLSFPNQKQRLLIKTYNGSTIRKTISGNSLVGLKKLGKTEGCTTFMEFLSLVNILLYRYTQQTDIIIGSAITGRQYKDLYSWHNYLNMIIVTNEVLFRHKRIPSNNGVLRTFVATVFCNI